MNWLRCLFGYHDLAADFNARFDICKRCHKRFRAV
jgi:hypothetical protein